MAKQGLVNARRKEKQRYTTKGTAFRTLGELIGYNLKVTFWSHVSPEAGVTSAAGTA